MIQYGYFLTLADPPHWAFWRKGKPVAAMVKVEIYAEPRDDLCYERSYLVNGRSCVVREIRQIRRGIFKPFVITRRKMSHAYDVRDVRCIGIYVVGHTIQNIGFGEDCIDMYLNAETLLGKLNNEKWDILDAYAERINKILVDDKIWRVPITFRDVDLGEDEEDCNTCDGSGK